MCLKKMVAEMRAMCALVQNILGALVQNIFDARKDLFITLQRNPRSESAHMRIFLCPPALSLSPLQKSPYTEIDPERSSACKSRT